MNIYKRWFRKGRTEVLTGFDRNKTGNLVLAGEGQEYLPAVFRIRDVFPGSRIRIFKPPDRGSKRFWIPDPQPHQIIKIFLTQNIVSKL
jgi:hypothetical protein